MKKDGSFSGTYYRKKENGPISRHFSYRNVSLIEDDGSFKDKLIGIRNGIAVKAESLKDLEQYKQRLETLRSNPEISQSILDEFQLTLTQCQTVLETRITELEKTFKTYLAVFKFDPELTTAIIAMEELFSKTSMYAAEGIPLSAPRFITHRCFIDVLKIEGNRIIFPLNHSKSDIQKLLEKFKRDFKMSDIRDEKNGSISFEIKEFKACMTEDRVRLVTNPETVSLKIAKENNQEINHLQRFSKLNIHPFPDLAKKLDQLYNLYIQLRSQIKPSKSNLDTVLNKELIYLLKMSTLIVNTLPKDLLTTRECKTHWGKLVKLQAKISSQLQVILDKILEKNSEFKALLGEQSIPDFFSKVDLLDIRLASSHLLKKAIQDPQFMQTQEFAEIIREIATIPQGIGYQALQEKSDSIYKKINKVLLMPADKIAQSEEAKKIPKEELRKNTDKGITFDVSSASRSSSSSLSESFSILAQPNNQVSTFTTQNNRPESNGSIPQPAIESCNLSS